MKILLLHGPNFSLLGERNPEIYGSETLPELVERLREKAAERDITLLDFQSNHEGAIIDELERLRSTIAGAVVNAGAYSHTSIALRDCFEATQISFVEVHISNIKEREEFRKHSYLEELALKSIIGKGRGGYEEALDFLCEHCKGSDTKHVANQ